MPRRTWFRLKSFTHLYLLFLLFALLVSGLAVFIYWHAHLPYEMSNSAIREALTRYSYFHDFNGDGYSEYVGWGGRPNAGTYFLKVTRPDGGVYDDFNIRDEVKPEWMIFGDYTGDGFEEVFLFTQNKDSLFLSVVNVAEKKWLIKRRLLMTATRLSAAGKWDLSWIKGQLLPAAFGEKPRLLFYVETAFAIYPRAAYVYDVQHNVFEHRFETAAALQQILLFDINGDGKKEVILTSNAGNNVHLPVKYGDDRCWLFILNQELKLLAPPFSIGRPPSTLTGIPAKYHDTPALLLRYSESSGRSNNARLMYLSAKGRILMEKSFPGESISSMVRDLASGNIYVSTAKNNPGLIQLSPEFTVLRRIRTASLYPYIHFFEDFTGNGRREILAATPRTFWYFDDQLKLLAKYQTDADINGQYGYTSLRYRGPGIPPQPLFAGHGRYAFVLSLRPNRLFRYLPLLFFLLSAAIFLFLYYTHKGLEILYTYISYFLYSLNHTAQAVLILDHRGRIRYLNNKVQQYLNLPEHISRGAFFGQVLAARPAVVACIRSSFERGEVCNSPLTWVEGARQFRGEIEARPFLSPVGLIYGYMVEIRDHTELVLSDRIQLWSRTVQKIAHDIKTPLASIVLNLRTLQDHLERQPVEGKDEIYDDLNIMAEELNRIRDLTRGFLKFTNLERPKFQPVKFAPILNETLARFENYTVDGVEITTEWDEEIDRIWADPQQIGMVLQILLENAIDAIEGKGNIQIGCVLAQKLLPSYMSEVEVTVSDNGRGVPEAARDHIFDPLFSTKKHGTGMGLAIAKKIVEDHSGEIRLESKDGWGTSVYFAIPAYEEKDE